MPDRYKKTKKKRVYTPRQTDNPAPGETTAKMISSVGPNKKPSMGRRPTGNMLVMEESDGTPMTGLSGYQTEEGVMAVPSMKAYWNRKATMRDYGDMPGKVRDENTSLIDTRRGTPTQQYADQRRTRENQARELTNRIDYNLRGTPSEQKWNEAKPGVKSLVMSGTIDKRGNDANKKNLSMTPSDYAASVRALRRMKNRKQNSNPDMY